MLGVFIIIFSGNKFFEIVEMLCGKVFQHDKKMLKKIMAHRLAISARKTQQMNIEINNKEFNEVVLEGTRLSIVQFKTEWNGTCAIIAPIYEELATSYDGLINFFTIDADKEKSVSGKFRINETPTILFFQNGNLIDCVIGLISRNILISKIESALTNYSN